MKDDKKKNKPGKAERAGEAVGKGAHAVGSGINKGAHKGWDATKSAGSGLKKGLFKRRKDEDEDEDNEDED
jgi:hypothetical protein